MAASLTAVRTLLKGVQIGPGQWHSGRNTLVCQCLRIQAGRCRLLHVSAASMCSSRTEHSRTTEKTEGYEYIPRKKAKNPMMPIGYAWMIGLPTSIIGFILAKREVDKNRLKQLKIRQRMKMSNEGQYEGSRYRIHTETGKLEE